MRIKYLLNTREYKLRRQFMDFKRLPKKSVAMAVVAFALVGVLLLTASHAATPTANFEAEAGTRSGNASIVSDSTASSSSAVKFSVAAGTCTTSTPNVPGGPDNNGGCWPSAATTGVPAGTTLTNYTGCSGGVTYITTPNTVIDSKTVNCDIAVQTTGVVIKNSKVNGAINTPEDSSYSFSVTDSEINSGVVEEATVGTTHITLLRVNIRGGETSLYCYMTCDIRDSYIHDQAYFPTGPSHLGGILGNDGPTHLTAIHNSLFCDTPVNPDDGGCSGDLNLFGDFGQIDDALIDHNLFGASPSLAYCTYGGDSSTKPYPHAQNVRYTNNIFQRGSNNKCGSYGASSGFNISGTGNVWTNNKWDDGANVVPEN